jgi:hypothetical protein
LTASIFYARNPRKNDAAVDRMCGSIREFGFKIPVLARSDGEVVDGHLRLKAARKLGITEVPVLLCRRVDSAAGEGVPADGEQVGNVGGLGYRCVGFFRSRKELLQPAEHDLTRNCAYIDGALHVTFDAVVVYQHQDELHRGRRFGRLHLKDEGIAVEFAVADCLGLMVLCTPDLARYDVRLLIKAGLDLSADLFAVGRVGHVDAPFPRSSNIGTV